MIRNLKVLMLAAMALAAFGVTFASGAQAAELKFHCSVEPCRYTAKPDLKAGEKLPSKTAHQVFIVENATESVSFTCEQITGAGESEKKTATELTLGSVEEIKYDNCTVNGSAAVTVEMDGCKYLFNSTTGTVSIKGCEAGKHITIKLATGAIYTIKEQGPLNGITYHTSGAVGARELTVETNVHGIKVECDGTKAQCLIDPASTLEGTYTTGNTIVTGETKAGVMAESWFE